MPRQDSILQHSLLELSIAMWISITQSIIIICWVEEEQKRGSEILLQMCNKLHIYCLHSWKYKNEIFDHQEMKTNLFLL